MLQQCRGFALLSLAALGRQERINNLAFRGCTRSAVGTVRVHHNKVYMFHRREPLKVYRRSRHERNPSQCKECGVGARPVSVSSNEQPPEHIHIYVAFDLIMVHSPTPHKPMCRTSRHDAYLCATWPCAALRSFCADLSVSTSFIVRARPASACASFPSSFSFCDEITKHA